MREWSTTVSAKINRLHEGSGTYLAKRLCGEITSCYFAEVSQGSLGGNDGEHPGESPPLSPGVFPGGGRTTVVTKGVSQSENRTQYIYDQKAAYIPNIQDTRLVTIFSLYILAQR